MLAQNALRPIWWELDRGRGTYPEISDLRSHQTGIRQKKNNPYFEKRMGINVLM